MQAASEDLDFERAAIYRDRLAALSHVQSHQGINPQGIEEADVFAIHQEGGQVCIQVFFFRTGQNWGNRAYFPKADPALEPGEVLGSFLAQFYDDKPRRARDPAVARRSTSRSCWPRRCRPAPASKVAISVPQRGEKKDLVDHALQNAREALGRRLAETSTQARLLDGLAETFGLEKPPVRIEVYDNSHIMGTNAVGAMVVAGPEGFVKNQYRKFNIRSTDITPGDDFGMMREVMERRFSRLIKEHARGRRDGDARARRLPAFPGLAGRHPDRRRPGPDDGGARDSRPNSASQDRVVAIGVAKGQDREAGRERFFVEGKAVLLAAGARSRCSISSSGCATRRIASPSARTARGARRRWSRTRSTRSAASARPQARAAACISAPPRRSAARRWTI